MRLRPVSHHSGQSRLLAYFLLIKSKNLIYGVASKAYASSFCVLLQTLSHQAPTPPRYCYHFHHLQLPPSNSTDSAFCLLLQVSKTYLSGHGKDHVIQQGDVVAGPTWKKRTSAPT